MDRQIAGWMDERLDELPVGRTDEWMVRWMAGLIVLRLDKKPDG